jgi:FkbM family methyltransferase
MQWQISSRIALGPVIINFVNESQLIAKRGLTGVTGNIYTGLHEFEDMAFVLHLLRYNDLFVDVGANVGSYTVLASAVIGAKTIAIEPIPETLKWLQKNILINDISKVVSILNIAIGDYDGYATLTTNKDTINHVVSKKTEKNIIEAPIKKLDSVLKNKKPLLIKIDVEGFETQVIDGALKTLKNDSLIAIIMELNGCGKRYGNCDNNIHCTMLKNGFQAYAYQPFKRELFKLDKNNTVNNTIYLKTNYLSFINNRIKEAPKIKIFNTYC